MKNREILQNWAKEINKDWTGEYSAIVPDADNELRVKHNNLVIAVVDDDFDIDIKEQGFDEAIDQLQYMITR